MQALQRQVDELVALQAMFPAPGELVIAPEQQVQLTEAQELLAQQREALPASWSRHSFSGVLHLLDCPLHSSPVSLSFHLGPAYPAEPPQLQVVCEGSRGQLQDLTEAVEGCAREAGGTECIALCAQSLRDAVEHLQQQTEAVSAEAHSAPATHEQTAQRLMQRLIWFHHIKSLTKRKHIVAWAAELGLGGYSKPGYPGIIVCEGLEADIEEYTTRLRALRWAAMAVRGDQYSDDSTQGRQLPGVLRELDESGMSELSVACEHAGLKELFMTAMKL